MRQARAQALRDVHERHAAPLWRYVMSLTGDAAEADDVVQETLIRAWKAKGILDDPPEKLGGRLFTVARNLVIDRVRSAQRRHEHTAVDQPDRPISDRVDQMFDAMLLQEALAAVSTLHREVIVRAYFGSMTTVELAEELQIAEGTVKSRLHYGLRALRLALQERGVSR
ncbi:sigma-70 family RNA polymerase sigma factor [Microbacterium sp. NPDC089695]|uniref:sigma-70 family RNA polymerase sigma factor n=1 Tax=Microbacterium sp. NPDC089695 TaxID=3364198 RepID=UPI00380A72E5